jgi:hypothetical protein
MGQVNGLMEVSRSLPQSVTLLYSSVVWLTRSVAAKPKNSGTGDDHELSELRA